MKFKITLSARVEALLGRKNEPIKGRSLEELKKENAALTGTNADLKERVEVLEAAVAELGAAMLGGVE